MSICQKLALASAVFAASASNAALLRINGTATPAFGSDSVSFSLLYNTSAARQPGYGAYYDALSDFTYSYAGQTGMMDITNAYVTVNGLFKTFNLSGVQSGVAQVTLQFSDLTGGAGSSDALPTATELAAYPIVGVTFTYSPMLAAFSTRSVSLDVHEVGPSVPEPATWGMMILGFGALGVAMRRKGAVRANAPGVA